MAGLYIIFFFKQKTAYELRISDWSSDVCSSDLAVKTVDVDRRRRAPIHPGRLEFRRQPRRLGQPDRGGVVSRHVEEDRLVAGIAAQRRQQENGREACRERVCPSL